MVAYVLEVPWRAGVARDGGLPARAVQRRAGQAVVQSAGAGDVAERQAFRREPHAGRLGVLQGPAVGADAEVVRGRPAGRGEGPALVCPRRVRHPRHARAGLRHGGRQHHGVERIAPCRLRQAHHGRLLRDLAAAAHDGQRGGGGQVAQRPSHLGHRRGGKGRVPRGVVHAGEHQVLPDHQAQLIAQVMERLVLVMRDARHAQHVQPGVARQAQLRRHRIPAAAQADQVRRQPRCTAAEHRHAVHAQVQPLPNLDAAEADAAQRQACPV